MDEATRQCAWPQQAWTWLTARLLPTRLLQALWTDAAQPPDALATVVFSRGSTGTPRGVMLSHHHLLVTIEGLEQVFTIQARDCVMGVLSFHYALGGTITLWFPLVAGCGVVYHARTTEAGTVGEMIQRYWVTVLLGMPGLYAIYVQECPAAALALQRYAMNGAARLDAALAQAFKAKYGLDLFEGYGCAEMTSVIAVNTGSVQYGTYQQVGWKPGSVGHPLPGIAVKIVDAVPGEPLAYGTRGLLLVHGAHRMLGYCGQPAYAAQVVRQGWCITGALASMDADDFLWIAGRLAG